MKAERAAFDAWVAAGQSGEPPKEPYSTSFAGLRTLVATDYSQVGVLETRRLQPFGGLIDGFIYPRDARQSLDAIRKLFMKDRQTGTTKGILEVSPHAR